jgi:hypothetical protein
MLSIKNETLCQNNSLPKSLPHQLAKKKKGRLTELLLGINFGRSERHSVPENKTKPIQSKFYQPMKNPLLIGFSALCVLALVAIAFITFSTPAPIAKPPKPETAANKKASTRTAASDTRPIYSGYSDTPVSAPAQSAATPQRTAGPAGIYAQTQTPLTEKERIVEQIYEIASNASPGSPNSLRPMLRSPDREIRLQAVEAFKQLDTPEAAKALQEEAQRTTDPELREEMLSAAELIGLPPITEIRFSNK